MFLREPKVRKTADMRDLDWTDFDEIVVDDEPDNLDAFRFAFRKSFKLSYALGGEEALKVLAGCDPAVIVADQRMPAMSGIELLREANVQLKAVQAIVSGVDVVTTVRSAFTLGVENVLAFAGKDRIGVELPLDPVYRGFGRLPVFLIPLRRPTAPVPNHVPAPHADAVAVVLAIAYFGDVTHLPHGSIRFPERTNPVGWIAIFHKSTIHPLHVGFDKFIVAQCRCLAQVLAEAARPGKADTREIAR